MNDLTQLLYLVGAAVITILAAIGLVAFAAFAINLIGLIAGSV
jgi:hypothetical protein